jgi:hypothetical protein
MESPLRNALAIVEGDLRTEGRVICLETVEECKEFTSE